MTATCHQRSHLAYCDRIPAIVHRFAEVAGELDPAARVPTTPDWSVADLARHIGGIHRWATSMVSVLSSERISASKLNLDIPEDASALPAWVLAGAEPLVAALRSADPDAPMWAWGSDKHARFWSRRMIHETTVHRADAEFAAAYDPKIEPAIAVDGIDEFLDNLPHAAYFAPHVKDLRGAGERIILRADDADVVWTIKLAPDGFSWDHSDEGATVTLEAATADLYLLSWGRRKPEDLSRYRVTGDGELLDFWLERSSS
jgi:uncharacterized protein (TIGR03083 family)